MYIEGATKFLISKLSDLQFFVEESMHDDGSIRKVPPTQINLPGLWFEGNKVLIMLLDGGATCTNFYYSFLVLNVI
ncbi:hypothetical protein ACE6H2_022170 [Prunus campanulata]